MPEILVAAVLIGVPLLVFGYLMKRYRLWEVIAGFNHKKILDTDGLADWVGLHLLIAGAASIFVGTAQLFLPLRAETVIRFYVVLMLVLFARAALGIRKYTR